MTKCNSTSINSHINQRNSFCWTIFHYFDRDLWYMQTQLWCVTRVGAGHLVHAGNYSARLVPFASLIFSSIFIRGPLRRPDYVLRDTDRFLQDSPIASLLADRMPRQVTLNTTRPITLHLSIDSMTINNEHRSYCAIKSRDSKIK